MKIHIDLLPPYRKKEIKKRELFLRVLEDELLFIIPSIVLIAMLITIYYILTLQKNVILDAYNANPTSMKAAIENFAKIPSQHKIVMIGGMMELGADSVYEHQQIVNLLQQFNWQAVILVGGDFMQVNHPYLYLENSTAAADWFKNQHLNNTYVLIKGSRSMQMEKILNK